MNKNLTRVSRSGIALIVSLLTGVSASPSNASSGTEAAAFLDIPVGGGPAALGAAYTPLATDAYAAVWNPAGLGFLKSLEFSGQHLSYLDTLHSEHLSFAIPFRKSGLGGSLQYLGSGNIDATELGGAPIGTFSSHYASYNLSYGRALTDKLSLGITGKLISAKIDDVSANAYAADLGSMYKLERHLTLAATLTNVGSELKFLSDGDPLPLAFHLGAAYEPSTRWLTTIEGVFPKTGLASFHIGAEWRPLEMIALRGGYRTDTVKELSALAGATLGAGLKLWGQELAYAWLPYGELGNTHYISLVMKLGEEANARRSLIQYSPQTVKKDSYPNEPAYSEQEQLIQLLNQGLEKNADAMEKKP